MDYTEEEVKSHLRTISTQIEYFNKLFMEDIEAGRKHTLSAHLFIYLGLGIDAITDKKHLHFGDEFSKSTRRSAEQKK